MTRLPATLHHTIGRRLALGVAVVTVGIASITAAQAAGPRGPEASAGDVVARALRGVKDTLNLDTSQQLAWDNAVANARAAREANRAARVQVRDAMQAELAKAEPDLAAVAAVADRVADEARVRQHDVRNEWLRIYGMLSAEQKAVVRTALLQRVGRLEQMRETLRGRTQR